VSIYRFFIHKESKDQTTDNKERNNSEKEEVDDESTDKEKTTAKVKKFDKKNYVEAPADPNDRSTDGLVFTITDCVVLTIN
jgi:hypothetical protein